MNIRKIWEANAPHFALLLGAMICSSAAFAAEECSDAQLSARRMQPFLMFDGTLFQKKPDVSKYGIKPLTIIDRGIWPAGASNTSAPDPALVKGLMQKIPKDGTPVVLDFESYPVTGSDEVVKDSIAKMSAIMAAFKAAAPDRKFGFYATLPIRDYWRAAAGPGTPKYQQWQAENDKLRALEQKTDALFPSIYTFYDDRPGWVKYAKAQICEARRLSKKPVYVFLWTEYHNSNKKLGGMPIEADYWKIQLETVQKYADGVVIWGGFDFAKKHPADWDENVGWWKQTKEFAKNLK